MKHQGYGSATLSFEFEAAHRQPEVGGKCSNMHGHSWKLLVTLFNRDHVGGVNDLGLSVEFSTVKAVIRNWIDFYFDHATLIGTSDPLLEPLLDEGCKVFIFGELSSNSITANEIDNRYYEALPWPSVEAVAFCLGERLSETVRQEVGSYAVIEGLLLSETDSNSFGWTSPEAPSIGALVDVPSLEEARQRKESKLPKRIPGPHSGTMFT